MTTTDDTELPISQWPLGRLQDEVATLAARIAAATGRFLMLLGELDARQSWEEGLPTLAHWLSWRTGMVLGAAREHLRVARALRELPKTAEALSKGHVSYSKVRALARVASPDTEETFLEVARGVDAAKLERIVAGVRNVSPETEKERAAAIEERREIAVFYDRDGMLVVSGRLAPEEGATFLRALETTRREMWKQQPADGKTTCGQQRASAPPRGSRSRRCRGPGQSRAGRSISARRRTERLRGDVPPARV